MRPSKYNFNKSLVSKIGGLVEVKFIVMFSPFIGCKNMFGDEDSNFEFKT